ncbi:DoxX family protein [Sphingomonas endolithica]|uniref:DoxX family protein n=1 Tax=Sphingomonas endolithica TaxID=2972485 RepID=UPI0021B00077|nr:DoxX family protein [Sphingomonas sp. ZFBP2030]
MIKRTIQHRAGLLMSTIVAFILIADGLIGLLQPNVFASDMASDGWGSETLLPVAMLALISGVLYAVPRTAVLGAILITGFIGGALAAHLRVTQAVIVPEIINVALGVGAWGGLWLRDPRLRALLPLR